MPDGKSEPSPGAPRVHLRELPDGTCWLSVDTVVSKEAALEIMKVLKAAPEDK